MRCCLPPPVQGARWLRTWLSLGDPLRAHPAAGPTVNRDFAHDTSCTTLRDLVASRSGRSSTRRDAWHTRALHWRMVAWTASSPSRPAPCASTPGRGLSTSSSTSTTSRRATPLIWRFWATVRYPRARCCRLCGWETAGSRLPRKGLAHPLIPPPAPAPAAAQRRDAVGWDESAPRRGPLFHYAGPVSQSCAAGPRVALPHRFPARRPHLGRPVQGRLRAERCSGPGFRVCPGLAPPGRPGPASGQRSHESCAQRPTPLPCRDLPATRRASRPCASRGGAAGLHRAV